MPRQLLSRCPRKQLMVLLVPSKESVGEPFVSGIDALRAALDVARADATGGMLLLQRNSKTFGRCRAG